MTCRFLTSDAWPENFTLSATFDLPTFRLDIPSNGGHRFKPKFYPFTLENVSSARKRKEGKVELSFELNYSAPDTLVEVPK